MKNALLGMAMLAGVLAWGTAQAASPCCAVKECPAGKTAVKGGSAAQAKCCTDVTDPTTCTGLYAAGYACNNFEDNPAGASGGQGCVEDPTENTCAGGNAGAFPPAGCVQLAADQGTASGAECTNDAVDACCQANACH